MSKFIWYIPSFYGDVRLERAGKNGHEGKETRVVWESLTATEIKGLAYLFDHAVKKGWTTSHHVPEYLHPDSKKGPYRAPPGSHGELVLAAGIAAVKKRLVGAMKPDREVLDFVKFTDGKIEEGMRVDFKALPPVKSDETALTPSPAAGVTVPKPTLGCPEPLLARADIRAREVLFAFLDDQQQRDFYSHNRFVTIGASGTRYMVTSRHNREALAIYRRQLFNLDRKTPLCVHHDLSVPVAEEMLTLHLMVQVKRTEELISNPHGMGVGVELVGELPPQNARARHRAAKRAIERQRLAAGAVFARGRRLV